MQTMQKFKGREKHVFPNGPVGWAQGGPFDALGPYAKVQRCPVEGTTLVRTVYATDYPDSPLSIPAQARVRGRAVQGYITLDMAAGVKFVPDVKNWHLLC